MTKPKNLNTQYGRTYLNWLNKPKPKQIPVYVSTEDYKQFEDYYFGKNVVLTEKQNFFTPKIIKSPRNGYS